ncbi:MAG: hypothetical protein IKR05_10960 [Prevotella sp.]|nr:hypothetical protein [Prevotella sp.]MBR6263716.1 hypothetical protein [Prevotella sp.]
MFDKFIQSFKGRTELLIIITAALLLELLSASQYYFTRNMVEEQLEKHAENELTLKAVLIKSNLNSAEDILKNHIWDIRENLSQPDSVFEALGRMIVLSRSVQGGHPHQWFHIGDTCGKGGCSPSTILHIGSKTQSAHRTIQRFQI